MQVLMTIKGHGMDAAQIWYGVHGNFLETDAQLRPSDITRKRASWKAVQTALALLADGGSRR